MSRLRYQNDALLRLNWPVQISNQRRQMAALGFFHLASFIRKTIVFVIWTCDDRMCAVQHSSDRCSSKESVRRKGSYQFGVMSCLKSEAKEGSPNYDGIGYFHFLTPLRNGTGSSRHFRAFSCPVPWSRFGGSRRHFRNIDFCTCSRVETLMADCLLAQALYGR